MFVKVLVYGVKQGILNSEDYLKGKENPKSIILNTDHIISIDGEEKFHLCYNNDRIYYRVVRMRDGIKYSLTPSGFDILEKELKKNKKFKFF